MTNEKENEKNEVTLDEVPSEAAPAVSVEEQPAENPAPVMQEKKEDVPAEEEKTPENRSVWAKIGLIGSRVLMVFSLIIVLFTCISSFTFNKDDKKLFGVKMYVVLTDSMKATDFAAGDLIFVKDYDFDKLKAGDIITFVSQSKGDMYLKTISHKILEETTVDGQKAYKTYGTTTGEEDKSPVTEEWYRGKYVGSVPKVGHFFNFLKTTPGYCLFILLPFGLLIFYQALNCVKAFRAYREEQTAEFRSEKASLAKEREENQKLLEEMRRMREELAKQQTQPQQEQPKED